MWYAHLLRAVTAIDATPFLQAGWRSRLGATADAAMKSMAVAVLFDLADAALYFLDILTDIKVMQVGPTAAAAPHTQPCRHRRSRMPAA
jgi:hypothetical protein